MAKTAAAVKRKPGRQTTYNAAAADRLCDGLANGIPLRQLCIENKIGYRKVFAWADANPSFAARVAQAREIGHDAIADSVLDIADNGNPDDTNRARLRAETRLKLLSKWNPKKYGDKLQVDQDLTMRITVDDPTLALRQSAPAALPQAASAGRLIEHAIQREDDDTITAR